MIRQSAYAGQFYPGNKAQLKAMIESFVHKDAPREEALGLLAPHAGYIYSGPVVGEVLSRVKLTDTVIILGPNHTGRGVPFSIMTEGSWATPLGKVEIDSILANKLLSISHHLQNDLLAHEQEHSLEVEVPFLQYFKPNVKIVPIILGSGDGQILKEIGLEVAQAIRELQKDVLIFASSDMNHYESQGLAQKKDRMAIDAILNLESDELLKRLKKQNISMCGFAPAVVMMTAAKELGAGQVELVKYMTSGDTTGDYDAVVGYAGIIIKKLSPLVKLARDSVEAYVKQKKVFQPTAVTPEMKSQAGVFVCLKKAGDLRGCIGTFEPTQDNIAQEIVANAISSASRDPRFEPVGADELKDLEYTVDVLTTPEEIESKEQLDPKRYGVIVEAGYRRGLLLPDLEGVDSADYQLDIARQKGGIDPQEKVKLYRFEVKRYK
jgi:AmmeMemoRadiSam system protein B/AmmeMemoRadiSam system protein A